MGYHIYRVADMESREIGHVDDQAQGAQALEALMRMDGAGYFLIDDNRTDVFFREMKSIGVVIHDD